MKHLLILSLTCALLGQVPQLSAAPPTIKPEGVFKVRGPLTETTDLSGIASLGGNSALLVSDEEANIGQYLQFDTGNLTITRTGTVKLFAPGKEIDAEAVAALGGAYYVTGSHGYSAKKNDYQPNRYLFFKVSGQTASEPGTLSQMLLSDTTLAPYYKKPLGSNGINIEGLAAYGGQLYAGLRGPSLDGKGFVISFSPATALSGGSTHQLHPIALGAGNGIRSLAEVDGGLLMLTGTASPNGGRPAAVLLWNPASGDVKWLATLAKVKGSPEALLVTGTTSSHYEAIVFCDGSSKGPYFFKIPR